MISTNAEMSRLLMVRMNPNEDILLAIRQAVKDNNIRNAVILGGAGSVCSANYHVVSNKEPDSSDVFCEVDQHLDVISIQGLVIDGQVHAHIAFSDEHHGFGGHLEKGCRVLTFAAVALAELSKISLTEWDTPYKFFGQ